MFAAVGTFEYWTIKNNGSLILLSEQQLLDCDTNNDGCISGDPGFTMVFAFNKGVADGTKYVYTSGTTGKNNTCAKNFKAAWTLSNFCYGGIGGQESTLKNLVFTYGPMVVVMDASDPGFTNYQSGVFTSTICSKNVTMATLAVVRTV